MNDESTLDKNEAALDSAAPDASAAIGQGVSVRQKRRVPFVADHKDSYFAWFAFVLGFIFVRWVLFSWQGWGVTLFTLAFCGSVTVYLLKKGVHIPKAGWFWLAAVMLIGSSFSLWSNNGLAPWHGLLLFGSAVYWILCATGLLILGKTSNLILLDSYNALLVIPFGNFGCQYKGLAFIANHKRSRGKEIFSIALGLLLTFIVASIVLPLLMQADSGGFAKIINGILTSFRRIGIGNWKTFWDVILAIPIAAYMFGLVAGSAHKRGTDLFEKDSNLQKISALRVLPMTTVYILLACYVRYI